MTEPTTPALLFTGVIASALGPVLGPFSLILFSAVTGALLALGKAQVGSRFQGFVFLLVSVAVSLVLTGACVWVLTRFTPIPADVALMPVAFVLAASRQYLLDVIQKVVNAFVDALANIINKRS